MRTLPGEDGADTLSLHKLLSRASFSTVREAYSTGGKSACLVFAPYTVYKGKAALSARPILPTFSKLDSGGLKVDRRGTIMLTLWPAVGERKYDWEKKQSFALSATEVGSLISLGPKESCEFFHDPSKLSSNEGKVKKNLSVKPNDNGYFFQLNVTNSILKTNDRYTVPVSTAEFAVMRTAFSFALPHIMGWDRYTNQAPMSLNENPPKISQFLPSEWDK